VPTDQDLVPTFSQISNVPMANALIVARSAILGMIVGTTLMNVVAMRKANVMTKSKVLEVDANIAVTICQVVVIFASVIEGMLSILPIPRSVLMSMSACHLDTIAHSCVQT